VDEVGAFLLEPEGAVKAAAGSVAFDLLEELVPEGEGRERPSRRLVVGLVGVGPEEANLLGVLVEQLGQPRGLRLQVH
jgi:hypothetical protein